MFLLGFLNPVDFSPQLRGMKAAKTFPVEVKKGNSTVTIYHRRRKKKNKAREFYHEFRVAFYSNGARKLETFSTEEDARKRADGINDSVANGDLDAFTLKPSDRVIYLRAVESLKVSGVPLDSAINAYVEAAEILNGSGSLSEAARYFSKKHPANMVRKSVAEVVAELIAAKTAVGLSGDYLANPVFANSALLSIHRKPLNGFTTPCGTRLSVTGLHRFRTSRRSHWRPGIARRLFSRTVGNWSRLLRLPLGSRLRRSKAANVLQVVA